MSHRCKAENHPSSSCQVVEPEPPSDPGHPVTISLADGHLLLRLVAVQELDEPGHAQHGVVVRDDQPLPLVGLIVFPEVPHDGLSLAAVALKEAELIYLAFLSH